MCFKINFQQNCQLFCAYRYQYLCTCIRKTICNFQICSFVLSYYSMNLVQKNIFEISDTSHIDYASKETATIADNAEGASVIDDACASGKSSGENTIRFVSQISSNRVYVHISGSAIFNLFLSHCTRELTSKILRRIRKYIIFASTRFIRIGRLLLLLLLRSKGKEIGSPTKQSSNARFNNSCGTPV